MKFVFCGYDFSYDSLRALLADKHELVGILTFPCDQVFSSNQRLHALAKDLNIPITEEKPYNGLVNHYIQHEHVEAIVSMGYFYKIPDFDQKLCRGVNVHPSYLPEGRGLMPLPHILMHEPDAAGVTIHKLTSEFDAGDILLQQKLPVQPRETVETLSARVAMAMPEMIKDVMANLDDYWKKAVPQDAALAKTFPTPDDAMRTIDFRRPVADIDAQHRAFGHFGVLFKLEGEIWAAYVLHCWQEEHKHIPGKLCYTSAQDIVIAAVDGYVCITSAQCLSKE